MSFATLAAPTLSRMCLFCVCACGNRSREPVRRRLAAEKGPRSSGCLQSSGTGSLLRFLRTLCSRRCTSYTCPPTRQSHSSKRTPRLFSPERIRRRRSLALRVKDTVLCSSTTGSAFIHHRQEFALSPMKQLRYRTFSAAYWWSEELRKRRKRSAWLIVHYYRQLARLLSILFALILEKENSRIEKNGWRLLVSIVKRAKGRWVSQHWGSRILGQN